MSKEQFKEILRRVCMEYGLAYDAAVADYLIEMLEKDFNQPLRACYPRDVVNQIRWGAQYERRPPEITKEAVLQACKNYFITPA
jgi:hypothetical protein